MDLPYEKIQRLILRDENDCLDETRFELYAWIFKNSFNGHDLFQCPPDLIPLLATLAFLVRETSFSVDDADLFLVAYDDVLCDRVPEILQPPLQFNLRRFKGVFKFLKIYHIAFVAFDVLGLQAWRVMTAFDGVYLHVLGEQWKDLNVAEKQEKMLEVKEFRRIYCW